MGKIDLDLQVLPDVGRVIHGRTVSSTPAAGQSPVGTIVVSCFLKGPGQVTEKNRKLPKRAYDRPRPYPH